MNHTPEQIDPTPVAVEQVDRDAADRYFNNQGDFSLSDHFARHRLLGIEQGRAEMREELERFYIDCEFDGHNGPLLSIALVREDGDSIHIQADVEPMDLWVRRNVLPLMDQHKAAKSAKVYLKEVGGVIRSFIGDCQNPVIIADSPVDIGRFCHAISTGSDGEWASADYPLMAFEVHNIDCYPTTLEGAVQHNAWWDAMALREIVRAIPTAKERG